MIMGVTCIMLGGGSLTCAASLLCHFGCHVDIFMKMPWQLRHLRGCRLHTCNCSHVDVLASFAAHLWLLPVLVLIRPARKLQACSACSFCRQLLGSKKIAERHR